MCRAREFSRLPPGYQTPPTPQHPQSQGPGIRRFAGPGGGGEAQGGSEPGRLVEAERNVEVLDAGPAGTLAEVVKARCQHTGPGGVVAVDKDLFKKSQGVCVEGGRGGGGIKWMNGAPYLHAW